MNLFHLSYDVENTVLHPNEWVLEQLVGVLVRNLNSTLIKRPTATTLVFGSSLGYFDVARIIGAWAAANQVYFVVSQILPHEDGLRFYYYLRENTTLQMAVDACVRRIRQT